MLSVPFPSLFSKLLPGFFLYFTILFQFQTVSCRWEECQHFPVRLPNLMIGVPFSWAFALFAFPMDYYHLGGFDMNYEWLNLNMKKKTFLTRRPQSGWPKIGHLAGSSLYYFIRILLLYTSLEYDSCHKWFYCEILTLVD